MTVTKSDIPPRTEIDEKHTWNKPSVFASKADWEAACEELTRQMQALAKYQGRLSESAEVLAEYLELQDRALRLVGRVFVYGMMSYSVDTTDQDAAAMSDRGRGLFGQLRAATAFTDPELLAIRQETLHAWMKAEPTLSSYRHYVDDLFRKQQHVRSAEVEQVLGLTIEPFGTVANIYSMLTNAELDFPPATGSDGQTHTVAQGTIGTLLDSADREIRRTAWESFNDTHLAFKNTIATTLLTSVKQDVFNMRVRGFGSCLEASLHQNNIPMEVFHNLIDTYQRHLPTWHKYWKVRRRALGYDTLHPYDIWAPIAQEQPQVPYETAVDWICAGMEPLGEEYVSAMRRGCLDERWVDIYPNLGKRAGAFSNGAHETHPFIMMSHDDSMGGFSTLAHELGHSMHSYLSRQHQPPVYSSYSLFVAEVASNFNQALTRAYLREARKDDANFQIALIEEAMSNFHRYFFIMPALARFELEVHSRTENGQAMTSSDLNNLMADLFEEGYGGEMHIDRERVGITWATFSHLYMAFYVYQYATGISAAHALAENILTGDEDAARRYVEFLSMGGSVYPLDALKHAGVDMTRPDAVETTFGVLDEMVDRLEKLTGV
jgi:oligoendopeptidase F